MLALPLYRNQLIDLLFKSIDWFLYVDNKWINELSDFQLRLFFRYWQICLKALVLQLSKKLFWIEFQFCITI